MSNKSVDVLLISTRAHAIKTESNDGNCDNDYHRICSFPEMGLWSLLRFYNMEMCSLF